MLCILTSLFFLFFFFLTSLFTVARGSRRVGATGVSRGDTWVKCDSCFIFAFENTFMKVISSLSLA